MKKWKKNIIIIILIILIVYLWYMFFIRKNNKKEEFDINIQLSATDYKIAEGLDVELSNNKEEKNDSETINKIKEEVGLNASNDLYEINSEYDGTKILNIKRDLQYKVAFAGLIKQSKPQLSEIDTIFEKKYPKENGIWIEEKSRNKILEIIKENTKSNYEIDINGYLNVINKNQQSENDRKLVNLIDSNRKIIITLNSLYYEIDNVTGEIVEYPFEKLDDYQPLDRVISDNDSIIIITSNENNKITDKEIFEELVKVET